MRRRFAKVYSAAVMGLEAIPIEVEVDVTPGLHFFHIVGLPDKAVEESRDRLGAALKNSGFIPPKSQNLKLVVNLAPADVKKIGPWYDVPIAIAYLLATNQIKNTLDSCFFVGELALDGSLRPAKGVLSIALMARETSYKTLFVPMENKREAQAVNYLNKQKAAYGLRAIGVNTLRELSDILEGKRDYISKPLKEFVPQADPEYEFDLTQVHGHELAKRALMIAAAGGHNMLMVGHPGSGKTLLARSLPSILPKMTSPETLEVTKIYSLAGLLPTNSSFIVHRPFRNPHHTISAVAMIGGGTIPQPGEISLAHRGILFLDELPEFGRYAIESLRQPMEDGRITVSRAAGRLTYPARFQVVAAMNPCPCGNLGDTDKACVCTPGSALKYRKKISGPMLDRFDLQLWVPRQSVSGMLADSGRNDIKQLRQTVERARLRQQKRLAAYALNTNSEMSNKHIRSLCQLDQESKNFLENFITKRYLSLRTYIRVIKLARTIADLEESDRIYQSHISQAIKFRTDEEFFALI